MRRAVTGSAVAVPRVAAAEGAVANIETNGLAGASERSGAPIQATPGRPTPVAMTAITGSGGGAHDPNIPRTIVRTRRPAAAAKGDGAGRAGVRRRSTARRRDRIDAVRRRSAVAMVDCGIDECAEQRSGRARG